MNRFNHSAHKELWNWLSNNPQRKKEEWPWWWYYAAELGHTPFSYCFACEYNFWHGRVEYTCPLEWEYEGVTYNECLSLESPYAKWAKEKKSKERARLASVIRDLKVKPGIETE